MTTKAELLARVSIDYYAQLERGTETGSPRACWTRSPARSSLTRLLRGFAMMGLCFLIIAAVPGLTTAVVPFLLVYGVSYFLTEFGPNMTTFVMPSEL